MIKGLAIIIGAAVITAFTVNHFSPRGIALVGDWDPMRGVVSAKAKDDVVIREREIQDLSIVAGLYGKSGVLFVDARPRSVFDQGRISGAVSIPVGNAEAYLDAFLETYPPETHIITYCSGRDCSDSHELAEILTDVGYTAVQVFVDGFPAWQAGGFPIE